MDEKSASGRSSPNGAGSVATRSLLRRIGHELRTPLSAILGYSELLLRAPEIERHEELLSDVRGIHRAGTRLNLLLTDVLDLVRIESGEQRIRGSRFDLSGVLSDVALRLEGLSGRNGNRIETKATARDPIVSDRALLEKILFNLAENACKFTRDGSVELSARDAAAGNRQGVCIEVRDTGPGIPEGMQQDVFEPFVQADGSSTRSHEGTGLGLTLCREYVRALGGTIELHSRAGEGTRIRVWLPRGDAADLHLPGASKRPPHRPGAEGRKHPGENLHAVVIDDDAASRDLLSRYLGAAGWTVSIAASAAEGFERIADSRPDLVLLDIRMPGTDGWQVLRRLKSEAEYESIPVLVCSIVDDPQTSALLGACGHLVKPVSESQVLETLSRVAGAGGRQR